jgi:chromate reductase
MRPGAEGFEVGFADPRQARAFRTAGSLIARTDRPGRRLLIYYIQFKPNLVTDDGTVTDDSTEAYLRDWITEFAGFIDRVHVALAHPA